MLPDGVTHREGSAGQSPAHKGQEEDNHELEFNDTSHEVVSV
jgi:hypothetical protein